MILIYELHDEYYGFGDVNKYHYEVAYDHKNSQAEMLEEVSVVLKENNPIDEGMNSLRMIIPTLSGVGKIEDYVYMLEASAWKDEFYNCVTIAERVIQDENEALKIFSNFICQWGKNNA